MLESAHKSTEELDHDLHKKLQVLLQETIGLGRFVEADNLIVGEKEWLEWTHKCSCFGDLDKVINLFQDSFQSREENRALDVDHMNLEWSSAMNGLLAAVLDFEDFDSNSVVGLGNLLVQLARRRINPIVVAIAAVFALVECFDDGGGTKVCIFPWEGLYDGRCGGEAVFAFLGQVSNIGAVFPEHHEVVAVTYASELNCVLGGKGEK